MLFSIMKRNMKGIVGKKNCFWNFDVILALHKFHMFFDCVRVHVHNFRVGQSVSERSPVTGNVPVGSQQPVTPDGHIYSSVDDETLVVSSNPPYHDIVYENSQKPVLQEDDAYSILDISQQQEGVILGYTTHGTGLGEAASDN